MDSQKGSVGSYDAIRVYLWLGMLDKDAPGRARLIEHFKPMLDLTVRLGHVPEKVDTITGTRQWHRPGRLQCRIAALAGCKPGAMRVP